MPPTGGTYKVLANLAGPLCLNQMLAFSLTLSMSIVSLVSTRYKNNIVLLSMGFGQISLSSPESRKFLRPLLAAMYEMDREFETSKFQRQIAIGVSE